MRLTAWWSLFCVGLVMTGCDGGSGSAQEASSDGSIVSSAVQEVSAVSGDCAHLSGFFSELLDLTNKARAEAGLKPLRSSYQLGQSAQDYAEDLATQNFFSHRGKDGSTVSTRVAATGYDFAAAGENIAAGQRTARSVFRGWMNSDGHRKNILAEGFTEVGFGLFDATGSSDFGKYWVQNFGKPDGESSQAGVYIPGRCGVNTTEASVNGATVVAGVLVEKVAAGGAVPVNPLAAARPNQISADTEPEPMPEPAF